MCSNPRSVLENRRMFVKWLELRVKIEGVHNAKFLQSILIHSSPNNNEKVLLNNGGSSEMQLVFTRPSRVARDNLARLETMKQPGIKTPRK